MRSSSGAGRAGRTGLVRTARVTAVLAALTTVGAGLAAPAAAAGEPAEFTSLSKSASVDSASAGENVAWTLRASCSSLTSICIDATMTDVVPAEFTFGPEDIEITGAEQEPMVTVTGQEVRIEFRETSSVVPGEAGMWGGQTVSVIINTTLRSDLDPALTGTRVTNTLTMTGTNAQTRQAQDDVEITVPESLRAVVGKVWEQPSVVDRSGTENRATVTFGNDSNVSVNRLVLTEPAAGTSGAEVNDGIFDDVAISVLELAALPEGATSATVEVRTPSGWQSAVTVTALPASGTALLPAGVGLVDVRQLRLTAEGTLVPGGNRGSLTLGVVQRDTDGAPITGASVQSNVVGVGVTRGSDSHYLTATADFTLTPEALAVDGAKAFDPAQIFPGESSTVTVTGRNTSNTAATEISVTEPGSGGPHLAAQGLTFTGFGTVIWPDGAEEAVVSYAYDDGPGTPETVDPAEAFPAPESARTVVGFTVTFASAAGSGIAPDEAFAVPFTVTASATPVGGSTTTTNTVDLAIGAPGLDPVTEPRSGALTVLDPVVEPVVTKTLTPGAVRATEGQLLAARLSGYLAATTNVPVRELVVEDSLVGQPVSPSVWDGFDLVGISGASFPATVQAEVEVTTGTTAPLAWNAVSGGPWTASTIADAVVPAGATGIRVVYTPVAEDDDLAALLTAAARATVTLVFEATAEIAVGEYQNLATATATDVDSALVGADEDTDAVDVGPGPGVEAIVGVTPGKTWQHDVLYVYPGDSERPTQRLTVTATNASPVTVDEITLVDQEGTPAGGTSWYSPAFRVLDLTGISSVTVPAGTTGLVVTFTREDGSTLVVDSASHASVAAAVTAVRELSAADLADVVQLAATVRGTFQPAATLRLVADTVLREHDRFETARQLDTATRYEDIANTLTAGVSSARWGEGDEATALDSFDILPLDDQPLAATLTKSIAGTSSAVYQQEKPTVRVTLRSPGQTGAPWRYVLADTDLRFWNAFQFEQVSAPTSVGTVVDPNGVAVPEEQVHYQVEYRHGGTWGLDGDGAPTLTGAAWSEPVVDSTALPADVVAAEVNGVRVTLYAGDSATVAPDPYRWISGAGQQVVIAAVPTETLRTGGPVPTDTPLPGVIGSGGQVADTASLVVAGPVGETEPVTSTAGYRFTAGDIDIDLAKNPNNRVVSPGTHISYRLTLANNGTALIEDPVIVDTIDTDPTTGEPYLVFDPGNQTAAVSYQLLEETADGLVEVPSDPEAIVVTTNEAGSRIEFSFADPLALRQNQRIVVTAPMMVRSGLAPGLEFENHMTATTPSVSGLDTVDAQVRVVLGPSYWVTKDVREVPRVGDALLGVVDASPSGTLCDPTGEFFRYPCLVQTRPGGSAEWRVRVSNTGNVASDGLTLYDVFPVEGDTGVLLVGQDRGSTWSARFDGAVVVTAAEDGYADLEQSATWTVSYQTAADDRCWLSLTAPGQSVADPVVTTCPDSAWHLGVASRTAVMGDVLELTLPAGVTPADVTALRIEIDFPAESLFEPGEQIQFRYRTSNPQGVPDTVPDGAVDAPAWNSVAMHVHSPDAPAGQWYEVIEPVKAGIAFHLPSPSYAVGDRVWLDLDRDGVQDAGEPSLPGVAVTLLNGAGQVVATTTTGPDGRYLFEGLFPGEYQVQVTLNAEQRARYSFTVRGRGGAGTDSDVDPATGRTAVFPVGPGAVHQVPGVSYRFRTVTSDVINPTLDIGLVVHRVSVGDRVWLDLDGDGVQDPGEPGVPGVVLVLTGPDGAAVTDVHGRRVGPVTTDGTGAYLFGDLPLLAPGERYTVRIDREASAVALAGLLPTLEGVGSDRALDSSTWVALSMALTTDGAADLTLDFGFVRVVTPSPTMSEGSTGELASTGAAGVTAPALLALGLLVAGTGLLRVRRFRDGSIG